MNGFFNPSTTTKNFGSFSLCSTLPADRQTGRPADRQTGKINWYKQTLLFAFLMICSTFIAPQQSYGQSWEQAVMDSVRKIFPHDSMYVKNEVIIKFKPHALDLSKLCYSYSTSENLGNNGKRVEGTLGLGTSLEDFLDAQRFSVEELILDSSLVAGLKMYGGDSLRRITHANPCKDTLSLTRSGDTIPMADYLYMVVLINNDTSVIELTVWPTIFHQNSIDYTEPNFIVKLANQPYNPNDHLFSNQSSFKPDHINTPFAWQFEKGESSTLVAVFDNGIEYNHCDLGNGEWGPGKKVVYGRNIVDGNDKFYLGSTHGTPVAGIIGAYSNRNTCVAFQGGVAGIAGGWKNDTIDVAGCSLLAYKLETASDNIQGLRHAANKSVHTQYGEGVHVTNASLLYDGPRSLLKSYEEALNNAFENNLVQVSARGNGGNSLFNDNMWNLPACFDAHKMLNVGAYNHLKVRQPISSIGRNIDLLAPGGECDSAGQNLVYTTQTDGSRSSLFSCFQRTSAAAPHVAGTAALIHSYAQKQSSWPFLYPEDYEGIIKAATQDVVGSGYNSNYDELSGWGNLDLRRIFQMFQEGYRIYHFEDYDTNSYTYNGFSGQLYQLAVSNQDGKRPVTSGEWNARIQAVTKTITHDYKWLDKNGSKIYVWGRSGPNGPNAKQGWASSHHAEELRFPYAGVSTLHQTGFTGVYSGYGGNFSVHNMIHEDGMIDGNNNIANSHTFKLVTYQYEFRQNLGLNNFIRPIKRNLGMHYTVFAKPDPTVGVQENQISDDIRIFPNLTNNLVNIESDLFFLSNTSIKIVNALGVEYFNKVLNNEYNLRVNVQNFPTGMYFVTVSNGTSFKMKQFIIQK
ncbi:MAG: S8 family peptidase [Candidatus Kapabacteria bacterium]|nr:S8 family peptidase [Candidatus Kapabacteria bacterium]